MSERSPSAYPSYKPDPATAWMAVAGSGLIPRKATLELPMLPANRATRRLPRSRTRVATPLSERASLLPIVRRQQTGGESRQLGSQPRPIAIAISAASRPRHPECNRRAGPGGAIACVANQESHARSKQQRDDPRQLRPVRLAHCPGDPVVPPGAARLLSAWQRHSETPAPGVIGTSPLRSSGSVGCGRLPS